MSYQALCRELAASGPGTFGDLDTTGARSVLRRYADAWFAAAKRRKAGETTARFPRRRRALVPVRWYHGTFALDQRRLRLPTAAGAPPLWLRLDRSVPYPAGQVRSVTLLAEGGRLWVEVTAEVPVTVYPGGTGPDPDRAAGVDVGVIHPYAVAGPDGHGLLVSARAVRAEHRMHLADTKARRRAVAAHAPKPGQRGSRRWRKCRRRARLVEGRHRRRIRQAQHEAAKTVIAWAVQHRIGTPHRRRPTRRPRRAGRAAAQPTTAAMAARPGHRSAAGQGRTRRDHPAPGRRAGHVVNLPGLPAADRQTGGPHDDLHRMPDCRAP
ncbi:hypothetical protein [Dactylosporangium sp. CA-139066]|uniref:hypothetical protein n=1 Tax=Dactylosporangium sp. CA-139066 TaxID=3239930 RepID=UPI003D8BB831